MGVDLTVTLQVVRIAGLFFICILSIVAAHRYRHRLIFYLSAGTSAFMFLVYLASFVGTSWPVHILVRSGWIFVVVSWMGLLINYIDSGK